MARFILRYSGAAAPEEHAAMVAAAPNVTVVDRSPKMMLVEANEEDAHELAKRMPGWSVHPEVTYNIPDTRKRIGNQ
jgi:hypothetical protein